MTRELVLAIDVGLGTTDILAFDPDQTPENSVKLVVPSRTRIVAREIAVATGQQAAVVFSGPTMGGGPSGAAMRRHREAGLDFMATESAALTFADDLERVAAQGVRLIGDDEVAAALRAGAAHVRSGDVDLGALRAGLARLGAGTDFTGACVAVQDHGYSPHGSNRIFRFEIWQQAIDAGRPIASLFYAGDEIPTGLTRLRAAVAAVADIRRTLAADTGPAALYGALPGGTGDAVLVNVGNGHTLCVVARDGRLAGVYEDHTRRLDGASLTVNLRRFLAGELANDEVREAGGHGAVLEGPAPAGLPLFVTGPRRALLEGSDLEATYPAPFGDMMMTGPVGLLRAYGERYGIEVPA